MKPKFVGGRFKKQTEIEPVFDLYGDVQNVVYQIVADLKEKENDELRKRLAVSWKELEWFNAKMAGKTLQISITKLDGSLREPKFHPDELQKRIREAYDCLHRFEAALRKEFKNRTGKALTWVKPKEFADSQLVAMNGLHQFVAKKIGEIKTTLPGQKYENE